MGTGLKTTLNSEDVTGTVWVDVAQTPTIDGGTNLVAVLKTSDDQWYGDAETGAVTLNGDKEFIALTKVTLTADKIGEVYYMAPGTGSHITIAAGGAADVVIGVKSGEKVAVAGATDDTDGYNITASAGTLSEKNPSDAASTRAASAALEVGGEAIVLSESNT